MAEAIFSVPEEYDGKRIDSTLAALMPERSRAEWQRVIKEGTMLRNKQAVTSPATSVQAGDELTVPTQSRSVGPTEHFTLPILYENDGIIVVDKPAGLLVHAKGRPSGEPTVAGLLADHIDQDGTNRAGIVHRLDRLTSGVMVVAKNKETQKEMQRLFSQRLVRKTYIAFVAGSVADKEAELTWPIARNQKRPSQFKADPSGKQAHTHMKQLVQHDRMCEVSLQPSTGRTHQLRVHMLQYGNPILGDIIYAPKKVATMAQRLCLHAAELSFTFRSKHLHFESELPADMRAVRRSYA